MAVTAARPAVTTSATAIYTAPAATGSSGDDWAGRSFLMKNITGTASVFLGPSGVTTSNGYEWATADGPIGVTLEPGEVLYGIVASTTQTIHVLGAGR